MSAKCRCLLLCISAILLPYSAITQSQPVAITRYDRADGLAGSYIYHVYTDLLGYLWIGSDRGVSRFDGQTFTNYGIEHGMPDLRVDAIYMDHTRRLWIGTRRGILEFKRDTFIRYPLSDTGVIRFVFGFSETKTGELYALTNAGVYAWRHSIWEKVTFYPGYDDLPCRQMEETSEGLYLNYGDLFVLQKPDQSFQIIGARQKAKYFYLNLSKSGDQVYLSTMNGLYAIYQDGMHRLPGPAGRQFGLYTYIIDSQKYCWVGNEGGVMRYSLVDTSSSEKIYAHTIAGTISDILEQPSGVIWIADFNGLVRISQTPYEVLPVDLMPHHVIQNIIRMPGGEVLINDGRGEFHVYKDNAITVRKYTTRGFRPGGLIFDGYATDGSGHMWFQMRGFFLAMLKDNTLISQVNRYNDLGSETFDIMYDGHRKKVLAVVLGQNVPCAYDETRFSRMEVGGCEDVSGNLFEIHQCIDGTILFSTETGTIYAIDTSNACHRVYDEFHGQGTACKFYNDPSGDVWTIFAGRGAQRFALSDSFTLKQDLRKDHGLSTNNVFELCFDTKDHLWLSTDAGLEVFSIGKESFNPQTYVEIAAFDLADRRRDVIGVNRLLATEDGYVLLACDEEILRFNTSQLSEHPVPVPSVQIEEVLLNEQPTDWTQFADSLEGIFAIPTYPVLPYDVNAIAIRFNGILPVGSKGIEYSYFLHPLSQEWSVPSVRESVSFFKLPSGQYTFEARARLAGSEWSAPAKFSFQVATPFWETLWFRIVFVFLATGALIVAFRYRVRQLYKKARAKEQLRELKLNALKSQMNPHFIHNALNSIQSLIINDHSQEASSYISKFARLLRQVLEGGDKQLIPLDQELSALRLYVDLEKLRMNMPINYDEQIDPELSLHHEMIPPLILQPFVENALWHGLATKEGDKTLTLALMAQDRWIICTISDNGIGRKQAAERQGIFPEGSLSKSVEITRKRLEAFNQDTPPPLEYTDVTDGETSLGTRVTIRIRRAHR